MKQESGIKSLHCANDAHKAAESERNVFVDKRNFADVLSTSASGTDEDISGF